MSFTIYLRIFGYIAALALHGINSIVMIVAIHDEVLLRDPDIKNLASMQATFLTIWNVIFQMCYAGLSLWCDLSTLMGRSEIPKSIRSFRNTLFASIVYPVTMLVFIIFWPLFLYDRSMIFPEYIDKVFSAKSNYVMHIAIVPIALWEVMFMPRRAPKSHKFYIQLVMLYYCVYNLVLFYTYYKTGLWPYPILSTVYGTIFFPLLHLMVVAITLLNYFHQWTITNFFWGRTRNAQKNK